MSNLFLQAFFLVSVVYLVSAADPLPNYMLGRYELDGSDNYNEFLSALGVGWFHRQIATGLSPTQFISQSNGKVKITVSTNLYSDSTEFQIGVTYFEKDPRGGNVPAIATFDGSTLKRVRTPNDGLGFTEERTYSNGGNKMTLTLTIPGNSGATSRRYFRRA